MFTPCMMWENSKLMGVITRTSDLKYSAKLLAVKHAAEGCARRGGGADWERDGNRDREKAHLKKRDAQKARHNATSDMDKAGNIIGNGYMKCPVAKGPKRPYGAHYLAGVACGRRLSTGRCPDNHTSINNMSYENQLIWFDHIAAMPDHDFDQKIVTYFERVAGVWIRPK